MEGIVDIYMPDMKYGDSTKAPFLARQGLRRGQSRGRQEMHRQVGNLTWTMNIAERGLLVRHLVAKNVSGADEVLAFIANEISPDTYVNVTDQYRPWYRADEAHR